MSSRSIDEIVEAVRCATNLALEMDNGDDRYVIGAAVAGRMDVPLQLAAEAADVLRLVRIVRPIAPRDLTLAGGWLATAGASALLDDPPSDSGELIIAVAERLDAFDDEDLGTPFANIAGVVRAIVRDGLWRQSDRRARRVLRDVRRRDVVHPASSAALVLAGGIMAIDAWTSVVLRERRGAA